MTISHYNRYQREYRKKNRAKFRAYYKDYYHRVRKHGLTKRGIDSSGGK